MARWVESIETPLLLHFYNLDAGTPVGSTFSLPGPVVYCADSWDEIRDLMGAWTYNLSLEQLRNFFNNIHIGWEYSTPNNISRAGFFYDQTRMDLSIANDSNKTNTLISQSNRFFTSGIYTQGANRIRYLSAISGVGWVTCGTLLDSGAPQLSSNIPTMWCYNNTTYDNRIQGCNFFFAVSNGPGELYLQVYAASYQVTGSTIHGSWSFTTPDSTLRDEFNNRRRWVAGTSPYDVPASEGEGGPSSGTFDWSSDDVPDPPALTYSAVDTGFTRIYNPTLAQLQDFARYMWTDTNIFNTVWSIIARYFEDPMEAFISLSLLPIAIPNTTDPVDVKMLFLPTGKSMYAATQQFVTVECGSVDLSELWGSALDYSPNTKIDLFLPYIGTVPIDPDEVMNRNIKITYKVDICTGCCVAIVSVKLTKSDGTQAYFPLYQFSGNCAIQIPFTSSNMDRYVDAAIKAATIALTAGAGVAAGAGAAAAAKADTIAAAASSNTAYAGASLASTPDPQFGGPTAGIDKAQYKLAKADAAGFNRLSTALRGASEGIGIVTGAKPQFSHSAPFTANSGYMSYRVPFFIIKSPRLVNPDQYGKYNGYPSLTFQLFSNLSGYTEVQQVQLTNINATANELDEIQGLLKTGVIM